MVREYNNMWSTHTHNITIIFTVDKVTVLDAFNSTVDFIKGSLGRPGTRQIKDVATAVLEFRDHMEEVFGIAKGNGGNFVVEVHIL